MNVPQIEYNPLRVLGVFANATLREIEQNKAQLRAFARVGQEVQLPLWLNGLTLLPKLPLITNENLAQAEADLSLQDERINYARFWLERDSDHAQEDLEACTLLNDNRVNDARQLWSRRSDHAAQKNLLLLDVMEGNWIELASHATNCFKNDVSEFRLFMSEVAKSSDAANSELSHKLLDHFAGEPLKTEMKRVLENLHKQALDETINLLKHTDPNDLPKLKSVIDQALGEMCHVNALKNLLGSESVVYTYYANETAKNLCKLICHYGHPDNLLGDPFLAYQQLNELWGYLNENDPEYKELSESKRMLRPTATTHSNNSDDSNSCLINLVATFGLIWIFAFLGRTCDSSGRPDHHNELKQIEFDSKWLQQYHDRTAADDSLIKWAELYEERKQRLEAFNEELEKLQQEESKLKTNATEAATLRPPEEIKRPTIDAAIVHKMDSLMRQHQPTQESDSLTID